jgi:NAD(P)-dependent dehydrogenase (short-subunit alcohol dehydrogenase family)
MPTVLITGASRGIGREFADQFTADGWRVIATCRDPGQYDGEAHALDVTDATSVAALGRAMAGETIDLLINNAGIYGPRNLPFDALDYDAWEQVLRTNLMGPMRVAAALAGPVLASQQKKWFLFPAKSGVLQTTPAEGRISIDPPRQP